MTVVASNSRQQFALRVCWAVLGGLLMVFAFPDYGLWWLILPALMCMLGALRGSRPGQGALIGAAAGASFYLAHISWAQEFLGPIPWLALAGLMTLWWAGFGAVIAVAYQRLRTGSAMAKPATSAAIMALAIAGLWTFREWCSSTLPYNGFAWGRVAQSQQDSPVLEAVSWLGTSGLSFALVWCAAFALELVVQYRAHAARGERNVVAAGDQHRTLAIVRHVRTGTAARFLGQMAGGLAALSVLAVIPAWATLTPGDTQGETTILAVQGNSPGASYFIPSAPGQIIREHLDASYDALEANPQARPDLILWPEGSLDVNPVLNTSVETALNKLTERAGAPLLANTVTWQGKLQSDDAEFYNSQVLWTDGAIAGQYDKRRPVPFGEYVPDRHIYEAIVPDLIGLIQREYLPGERSNVLAVNDVAYGIFICFDIVDDELARTAVREGAQVLLAPTNNADFAYTHEAAQQLAFARMRAVETGRSLVQVSTVGMSASYAPDGAVLDALPWYTSDAMLVTVPLRTGTTPAVAIGRWLEAAVSAMGVLLAFGMRPRRE
ncbi:apolipoprotein N-acyltransferase [Gulosibacter bifidus]|nr:apolipoprotein N-acyltransferase [Gulosibacter bifidus]